MTGILVVIYSRIMERIANWASGQQYDAICWLLKDVKE
jgi:hypothetical protein